MRPAYDTSACWRGARRRRRRGRGSELHADEVATRWAAVGIDVVLRTSAVAGRAVLVERDGYRVVRRSGRYAVFVKGPMDLVTGRLGLVDGLVEIWNGMPWLSPLWSRLPRVVFLHHVHGEMWPMVLPSPLAEAGNLLESRLAPPFYRRSPIVTLSESSRVQIVALPGVRARDVSVVPPGINACYRPGGQRSDRPLVVAVGRLVPVKNFPRLIRILTRVRRGSLISRRSSSVRGWSGRAWRQGSASSARTASCRSPAG